MTAAIGELPGAFSTQECANYFANAGYGRTKIYPAAEREVERNRLRRQGSRLDHRDQMQRQTIPARGGGQAVRLVAF
jgi:hypothetical protein